MQLVLLVAEDIGRAVDGGERVELPPHALYGGRKLDPAVVAEVVVARRVDARDFHRLPPLLRRSDIAQQIVLAQARIEVEVGGDVGRVDLVDEIVVLAEIVVAQILRVGKGRVGPADFPVVRRAEFAGGLDRASEVAVADRSGIGSRIELVEPRSRNVVAAPRQPMGELGGHQEALPAHQAGGQQQVHVLADRHEIGHVDPSAIGGLVVRPRHAEALRARLTGIGQHQPRHPGDRHAQELDSGALEEDQRLILVVDQLRGVHLPADLAPLAVDAQPAGGVGCIGQNGLQFRRIGDIGRLDQSALVGGQRQRVEERFLHAIRHADAIGDVFVSGGIANGDIALGEHLAGRLVVAQAVRGDLVAVVVHDHAAIGADHGGRGIVGENVGLDIGRGAGPDLHVEEARRQQLGAGRAGQQQAERQRNRAERTRQADTAGLVALPRQRCPSSLNKRTVVPTKIATSAGTNAANAGCRIPADPAEAAISVTT